MAILKCKTGGQNFQQELLELIEENGIEIKFSEVNKSRRNDVPKHVKRILEEGDRLKHFLVVHNWISDEARRNWLTHRKRNPPQKEKQSVSGLLVGPNETLLPLFNIGSQMTISLLSLIARNEQDIYKVLEESGAEGNWFNSMVQEAHQYLLLSGIQIKFEGITRRRRQVVEAKTTANN